MYVNSFADHCVLPPQLIREIEPMLIRASEKVRIGGGESIVAPLFEVEIEVEDPTTNEVRRAKTSALSVEGEEPIIGIDALSKLKIKIDFEKGTYSL